MSPFVLPRKRPHTCYRPTGRNYGPGSIWLCPVCSTYWLLVSNEDLPADKRWQKITAEDALARIAAAESAAESASDPTNLTQKGS